MILEKLPIKLFADGADRVEMMTLCKNPLIKGFTTNPSLMRKAGIFDYCGFALEILQVIPERAISFEVFSDDLREMKCQAVQINNWGKAVYVKIPVTNSKGESTLGLIEELSNKGVKLNITALTTIAQVEAVSHALGGKTSSFISVFAGRIADTGIDPVPLMSQAVEILKDYPNQELIWASTREVLNIFQAATIGCPIITVSNTILKKLDWIGKDLTDVSLATVKMFREDAVEAGFVL